MLPPPLVRRPLASVAVLVLSSLGPQAGRTQLSHAGSTCRSPIAEEQLLRRETALLGRAHAAEHAQMRAEHGAAGLLHAVRAGQKRRAVRRAVRERLMRPAQMEKLLGLRLLSLRSS